ncbi:MAG: hypothetical protein K6A36_06535 [Paludibacteraceae bacterium]|nr:hypothetical protein [Paludibacteraceae bacterium]
MRCVRQLILFLIPCTLLLVSCEGTTFRSSVPIYPVRFTIDTRTGQYVHFVPEAINTYVTVDRNGYHYNGRDYALNATDMYGYAGVVVYINSFCEYTAYDLCCPNCAMLRQPCEIDGAFAICPHCGEAYDLASSTAAPQRGIAKECMLRLKVLNNGGRLTVSQTK